MRNAVETGDEGVAHATGEDLLHRAPRAFDAREIFTGNNFFERLIDHVLMAMDHADATFWSDYRRLPSCSSGMFQVHWVALCGVNSSTVRAQLRQMERE